MFVRVFDGLTNCVYFFRIHDEFYSILCITEELKFQLWSSFLNEKNQPVRLTIKLPTVVEAMSYILYVFYSFLEVIDFRYEFPCSI